MAKLKLFYSLADNGDATVWYGKDSPAKEGRYWGEMDSKNKFLDVVPPLPSDWLSDDNNDRLLKLLRPPGIRKGQCWEITVKVEKKRKNKP